MKKMNRRSVLQAGLMGSVAAALGPVGVAAASTEAKKTLRVATWGGSWRDAVEKSVSSKLNAHGIAVEYELGGPSDHLAKLIAARRAGQFPFSVLEIASDVPILLSQSGLMEKIDYTRLSNAKPFPEWMRGATGVAYTISVEGIVYNKEQFQKAGIPAPKTYMDLADNRLRGKVAFPNISHNQHWNAVVALAYENSGSESKLDASLPLLAKINPLYYYTSSIELGNRFGAGEIWAAPWQAGWTVRLKRQGVPVEIQYTSTVPGKRGAVTPNELGIVGNTPQRDAAYLYVEQFLAPDSQYGFGVATGTTPVSSQARNKMLEDPVLRETVLLTDADIANAFKIDWSALDARQWRDTWNRRK